MRSLTVLMSVGLMVFLGQQAVTLHKLTVCRQEAWGSAVTLHTRTLLTVVSSSEKDILPQCQILVARKNKLVSWTRMNLARRFKVPLHLGGKL